MTRRVFVMTCCVLVSATAMFAQSPGAKTKADPISGTWTGELSPAGSTNGIAITMHLKFDGKSSVSGTATGLPHPAEVKAGAFDPKTGALRLQLGKTGEAAILLVLEGKVVKGTASGRFSGEETGAFTVTKKV
jgi:hypothetical protein